MIFPGSGLGEAVKENREEIFTAIGNESLYDCLCIPRAHMVEEKKRGGFIVGIMETLV